MVQDAPDVAWGTTESGRALTVLVITGVVVALVGVVFAFGFPEWVKAFLVVLLMMIGALNFLALVGWWQRQVSAWRTHRHDAKIRSWPILLEKLQRQLGAINAALYENTDEHISLRRAMVEILQLVWSKEFNFQGSEHGAKLAMVQVFYRSLETRVQSFRILPRRNQSTSVFVQIVRDVSVHLDQLHVVYDDLLATSSLRADDKQYVVMRRIWETFIAYYGPVLAGWKAFVVDVETAMGWGVPIKAEPPMTLPDSRQI